MILQNLYSKGLQNTLRGDGMKKLKYIIYMMLVVMVSLSLVACGREEVPTKNEAPKPTTSITVYVPKSDASGVEKKSVTIPKEEKMDIGKQVKMAITLLLDKESKDAYSVFPKGLAVEDVVVKEDMAYITMNEAFLTPVRGSLEEQLEIASLVNTATAFPDVKSVFSHPFC